MRIMIAQGAFLPVPPKLGGAIEKMWFLLGQEFAKRGHEVTHISRQFDSLPHREVIRGVQHLRVKGYSCPRNGTWLKWLDLLYSLRAKSALVESDIVVTNTFWLPILTSFSSKHRVYVDVQRMPKGQMRFYRRAQRLRANSSAVEAAIHLDDPRSIGRTCMIPNPLTFTTNLPVDFSAKQATILYAGRIHPEKGIKLLLDAFSRLPAIQREPWRLRIVGPYETSMGGGGRAWMQGLRRQFEDHPIDWVEPIFDSDLLNDEYHRASIFAYPSLAEKGETFGLSVLESMAWGCIPVVSDLPCFRDFVVDTSNGLFFNHRTYDPVKTLSNSLLRPMLDASFRHQLAKNATEVRESHDVGTIAERFLADFQRICQNKTQELSIQPLNPMQTPTVNR